MTRNKILLQQLSVCAEWDVDDAVLLLYRKDHRSRAMFTVLHFLPYFSPIWRHNGEKKTARYFSNEIKIPWINPPQTVEGSLTETANILLWMQNDSKTLQVSSVSFKARCSAVEKSAASPVIHDDLEEEAPVAVFPPAQEQRISLDCILMYFFFPSGFEHGVYFPKYLYGVIFNVSISEGWLLFWNARWIFACTESDIPFWQKHSLSCPNPGKACCVRQLDLCSPCCLLHRA